MRDQQSGKTRGTLDQDGSGHAPPRFSCARCRMLLGAVQQDQLPARSLVLRTANSRGRGPGRFLPLGQSSWGVQRRGFDKVLFGSGKDFLER